MQSNYKRRVPSKYVNKRVKKFLPRVRARSSNVRISKSIVPKIHFYKQTYFPSATSVTITGGGSWTAGTGLLTGPTTAQALDMSWAMKFVASDLPQFAALSALYDTYKICKLVVKFVPQINSLTSASTATTEVAASQQFLSTAIDYDDSTPVAAYTDLMQYESFRETPMYKQHKRVLIPKCSMSAFKTSGTTIGYVQKGKQWIDAAYGDVEHYGLKGYTVYNTGHIQQQWKVFVTAYIALKQVR